MNYYMYYEIAVQRFDRETKNMRKGTLRLCFSTREESICKPIENAHPVVVTACPCQNENSHLCDHVFSLEHQIEKVLSHKLLLLVPQPPA